MTIEINHYNNLNKDGSCKKNLGNYDPKGGVDQGLENGKPWINISTPITKGKKTVCTFYFESQKEKTQFIKQKKASATIL